MIYVFTNIYKFGSEDEFIKKVEETLSPSESDVFFFMNECVPLFHAFDYFTKFNVMTLHRKRGSEQSWFGYDKVMARRSSFSKILRADDVGNIVDTNGDVVVKLAFDGYTVGKVPTTGYIAKLFLEKMFPGEPHTFVNYYGMDDKSSHKISMHDWRFEDSVFRKLRDGGGSIFVSPENEVPKGKKRFGMPIIYITDDNYVNYTDISIKSLLKQMEEYELDIRVICSGVSDGNKSKLAANRYVSTVDCQKSLHNEFSGYRHLSSAMFLKFSIPKILGDFDKCLYVDGDVLFNHGITELGELDIGDNYIAAVKDFYHMSVNSVHPMLKIVDSMYYTGLMVMNLAAMRKDDVCGSLYSAKKKIDADERFANVDIGDEEVFNFVLNGRIKPLPPKYCVSLHYIKDGRNLAYRNIELYNKLYGVEYGSIDDLINDAVVYHFHGNKDIIYKKDYVEDLIYKLSGVKKRTPTFDISRKSIAEIWKDKSSIPYFNGAKL